MKRLILLAFLVTLACVVPASASTVTVMNTDTSTYTKGIVCTVSASAAFEQVFRASDFNTDNTDRNSAVKLLTFLQDESNGTCYKLPTSGSGSVSIPDIGETYVVSVVMDDIGARVYWKITSVAGGIDQVVTIP